MLDYLINITSPVLDKAIINPFIQLSLILLVVLGVSLITRILKQPLIIGYIISGIIVGPMFLNLIGDAKTVYTFAELGIAFLLFVVGLHLSPKVIKEVGKVSFITGIGQILFTLSIGFITAILFGFDLLVSFYIAIALTFSSTIIIMKLISDKDALEKLYGKIAIGFLLVQDFVAIIVLIIITSMAGETSGGAGIMFFSTMLKGALLIAILAPISYFVLPKLSDFLSRSQEFLFLFSIAWGFGLSILFLYAGFSIEVGALIAGVLLSMSPYSYEISSKLKPLRDFFLIFFFIYLGSQMVFTNIGDVIVPTIVFALLIVVGNPLIVMTLMGFLRYTKKTSFMAGLTVAQIGEFSLIVVAMGVRVGHISGEVLSFLTLISLFTIFGCTYLIMFSEKLFNKFSKSLNVFERKKLREKEIPQKEYKYILLGYNRIGFSVIRALSKITKNFLVVDYDPRVVNHLKNKGIDTLYGDVDDSDFLEDLRISKASLIVSTIPEKEANLLVLDVLKRNKSNPIKILTARQIQDAIELYEAGADYVIMPHFLGGEYTANIIEKSKANRKLYEIEKNKELKQLKERLKEGHDHPKEKNKKHR